MRRSRPTLPKHSPPAQRTTPGMHTRPTSGLPRSCGAFVRADRGHCRPTSCLREENRIQRPSELAAVPRMTACTVSPSRRAAESGLSNSNRRANIAVGNIAEWLAPLCFRQEAALRHRDLGLRREQDVHTTCQRAVALVRPDALAGLVNRDEGRRAHGIHRDARPSQVEHIRPAIGQHGQRGRSGGVGGDPVAVPQV